jgi:hypothetical protein
MAISAIAHPTFTPAMRIISSITNANPALVTTTFAHGYITGEIVRITLPRVPFNTVSFGMAQINGQTGTITVVDTTSFTIAIDTTLYDVFSNPGTYSQQPQVVPVGEVNSLLTAATKNVLPGTS